MSVTDSRGRTVRDGGLARWLAGVAPRSARGELAIALVPDARMRILNRNYRRKDYATDVLSFRPDPRAAPASAKAPARSRRSASREGGSPESRAPVLGDIVIATGIARRQAREAGHSYQTELRVLALHGLLHLLGYDHEDRADNGRMARAEARLRKRGGLDRGLTRAFMIPLLVFLLAIAAVYVGTIETAFSALMKLSLRLMAERGGRDDRLGYYLENPVQLFIPVRLLLGLIFSLATVLIAIRTGSAGLKSISLLLLSIAIFIVVCEHLVPLWIIRRNPERVLEVILPPFDVVARAMRPLTGGLVGLIAEQRRERQDINGTATAEDEAAGTSLAYPDAGEEQRLIEGDERKLLQSIVDFGDTLVREVMTPRPDMVAIAADATLAELRALFQEQEYSRIPVYGENLDNILGYRRTSRT